MNQLESIDSTYLINLYYLNINRNRFSGAALTQVLIPLTKLTTLDAESNKITEVRKAMFTNQSKIEYISLWGNEIGHIQPGSFDHLVNLHEIDLKSNKFSHYRTESWHFCQSLSSNTLQINLEEDQKIVQDLKKDANWEKYCEQFLTDKTILPPSCSDDGGHLSCSGYVQDVVCQLNQLDFKSVTFKFPKDKQNVNVENFFEAETNSYFRNLNKINGRSNLTKYLPDLKLYGTKFDLSQLDDHVGLRTKTVKIFADTVYLSKPLENPINCSVSIRARVVSITEDIPMNLTREQFFSTFEADQPVETWAPVQEIITGVGNASFSVTKLGFIEIQQEFRLKSKSSSPDRCAPRIFNVDEYRTEHNTPPSVFFDFVQINLQRMAVRTLATTRSNDGLARNMAYHTIAKTANKNIVEDKEAYLAAQRLIRDKESLDLEKRNV